MPLTVAISPWQLIDAGEDGGPSPQLVIVPEAGQSPLTVITGPVAWVPSVPTNGSPVTEGAPSSELVATWNPVGGTSPDGGLVMFPTDSSTTSPAPICTGMSVSDEPLVLAGVSQK